jgi:hypothetical protein
LVRINGDAIHAGSLALAPAGSKGSTGRHRHRPGATPVRRHAIVTSRTAPGKKKARMRSQDLPPESCGRLDSALLACPGCGDRGYSTALVRPIVTSLTTSEPRRALNESAGVRHPLAFSHLQKVSGPIRAPRKTARISIRLSTTRRGGYRVYSRCHRTRRGKGGWLCWTSNGGPNDQDVPAAAFDFSGPFGTLAPMIADASILQILITGLLILTCNASSVCGWCEGETPLLRVTAPSLAVGSP